MKPSLPLCILHGSIVCDAARLVHFQLLAQTMLSSAYALCRTYNGNRIAVGSISIYDYA